MFRKRRFTSDELVDLMHSVNDKENKSPENLRLQVLLSSVRRSLRRELRKKQVRLQRQVNRDRAIMAARIPKRDVLVQQVNHVQNVCKEEVDPIARIEQMQQQQEEPQEDILGLDGFFSSLKSMSDTNDDNES